MNKSLKQKTVTSFILAIILFGISWFVQVEKQGFLHVYYLGVGQGDSALIEAPNGIQVLIDAGRGDTVIKELENVLPIWDRKINTLILSHGDLDHIGGFFEILEVYEIEEIIRSSVPVTSEHEKELLKKAQELGIRIQELERGDKIVLDQTENIYMDVYWPPKGIEVLDNRNKDSLVLELIHGENEFLFTGDATIETELELIKSFETQIDSDVLKVGHHGSKTSTSQLFLEKVTPDFSTLSYGNNSYGHPNKEVLENLEKSGTKVFHTKDRATIAARSNGEVLEINYLDNLFKDSSLLQSLVSSILVDSFDTSS